MVICIAEQSVAYVGLPPGPIGQRQTRASGTLSYNAKDHWKDCPTACNHFVTCGGPVASDPLDQDMASGLTQKQENQAFLSLASNTLNGLHISGSSVMSQSLASADCTYQMATRSCLEGKELGILLKFCMLQCTLIANIT